MYIVSRYAGDVENNVNDPFNTKLVPGCKGTVKGVDDIGTIHVQWDCGSSLGVAYGEDVCRKVDD